MDTKLFGRRQEQTLDVDLNGPNFFGFRNFRSRFEKMKSVVVSVLFGFFLCSGFSTDRVESRLVIFTTLALFTILNHKWCNSVFLKSDIVIAKGFMALLACPMSRQ